MNDTYLMEPSKPKTAPKGLGGLLQIINSFAHIPGLAGKGNKKFNEAEAELFSHMQIFDASTLLSISDLKGNIIYVNEKFCEISKYSRKELIGKPHSIIRHPDTPSIIFKELWNTISKGKVWHGELKNKAKDGTVYWVLATIAPILGKSGKPVKYISMRLEINKQKLAEKELIEAKEKIDIKLHENVNYAKHVHNSFLTGEEDLEMSFPDSFLIYKALKIISGDFYRVEKRNNYSAIILGDSTGHGVSASYISIMVLNTFTRLLKIGPNCPQEILHGIHKELKHIRNQNKKHPIHETADTILCCIDHATMQMAYASAKMKGLIIRKNELIELNKDRCSIGELCEREFILQSHKLPLKKNDCLYLFTDGMTDQIGGEMGKTIKYKYLKEVLFKNHHLPMKQQKKNINKIINEWRGENEQTDDMTMLGLKIN